MHLFSEIGFNQVQSLNRK